VGDAIGGEIARDEFRLVGWLGGENGAEIFGGMAREEFLQGLGVVAVCMEVR